MKLISSSLAAQVAKTLDDRYEAKLLQQVHDCVFEINWYYCKPIMELKPFEKGFKYLSLSSTPYFKEPFDVFSVVFI